MNKGPRSLILITCRNEIEAKGDTLSYHYSTGTSMESADKSFGPFCHIPGEHIFDFTLLFEDTILSILPSSLLLLTAPLRILQLWHASRKVRVSRLRTIKMVCVLKFRGKLALTEPCSRYCWSASRRYKSRTWQSGLLNLRIRLVPPLLPPRYQ